MSRQLLLTTFGKLSIDDPFFDSLKAGYTGFPQWFKSKTKEELYIVDNSGKIEGMIYLKVENAAVDDVTPPLAKMKWLKVGTLKIVPKGTKLGERVLKKIFDTAINKGCDGIYVTVFSVHKSLISLFRKYGFEEHATKTTSDGTEVVLVRSLSAFSGDLIKDYPFIHRTGKAAWLLGVYPEYHSKLLPDSILNNEPKEIVEDVSHSNTIHKMYIGRTALSRMSRGDAIVIYRTTDKPGLAKYRSVTTSVCVVEEVKRKIAFKSADDFVKYTKPHSVFSESELREQYAQSSRVSVVKMTYNAAFNKRTIRERLLEEEVISPNARCDLLRLSDAEFSRIMELGEVNARLIID